MITDEKQQNKKKNLIISNTVRSNFFRHLLSKFTAITNKYKKDKNLEGFWIVFGGTAISQIITIAITPILTRIYGPSAYGIQYQFTSFVSGIMTFGSLGLLNGAMEAAKSERKLRMLVITMLVLVLLCSFLFLAIFYIIVPYFQNIGQIKDYVYFLPIVVLIVACARSTLAINYWRGNVKKNAFASLSGAVVGGGTKLIGGVINNAPPLYLIAGNAIQQLCIVKVGGLVSFVTHNKNIRRKFFLSRLILTIKSKKSYIKYRYPQDIIGSAWIIFFPTVFVSLYGSEALGLYALAFSMLYTPTELVCGSMMSIFSRHFRTEYYGNGDYIGTLKRYASILFWIGLPALLLFYSVGADIFSYIFGTKWKFAGLYANALCLMVFSVFVSRPYFMAANIFGFHRLLLSIEVIMLLGQIAAIVFSYAIYGRNALYAIWSISASVFLINMIAIWYINMKLKNEF